MSVATDVTHGSLSSGEEASPFSIDRKDVDHKLYKDWNNHRYHDEPGLLGLVSERQRKVRRHSSRGLFNDPSKISSASKGKIPESSRQMNNTWSDDDQRCLDYVSGYPSLRHMRPHDRLVWGPSIDRKDSTESFVRRRTSHVPTTLDIPQASHKPFRHGLPTRPAYPVYGPSKRNQRASYSQRWKLPINYHHRYNPFHEYYDVRAYSTHFEPSQTSSDDSSGYHQHYHPLNSNFRQRRDLYVPPPTPPPPPPPPPPPAAPSYQPQYQVPSQSSSQQPLQLPFQQPPIITNIPPCLPISASAQRHTTFYSQTEPQYSTPHPLSHPEEQCHPSDLQNTGHFKPDTSLPTPGHALNSLDSQGGAPRASSSSWGGGINTRKLPPVDQARQNDVLVPDGFLMVVWNRMISVCYS